jgi:hypothetical protein
MQSGNVVTYLLPRSPEEIRSHRRVVWGLAFACAIAFCVAAGFMQHFGVKGGAVLALASLGSLALGLNTVAYETPVTGATAPTAGQSRTHNQVTAIVTGDNSATTFTITHNWGLTTAQLAAGAFPRVEFEPLLAAFTTAAPLIASKTANTVTFTCTAFTGAAFRVVIWRPSPAEVVVNPQP